MAKKNKKGFTLTELIVVIAIIAILAAVLIPTSISFIKKAKRSNDEQLAAQMTKEIGWYCIENDINQTDLNGIEIRTILRLRGFDLTPKTNEWTFVYEQVSKKVILNNVVDNNISAIWVSTNPIDPTNYSNGNFLLGKGESNIEKAIDLICNLKSKDDYIEALSLVQGNSELINVISSFNPETTIYLNNSTGYTLANSNVKCEKVVYSEGMVNVPNLQSSLLSNLPDNFILDNEVLKSIDENSNLKEFQAKELKVLKISDLHEIRVTFSNNVPTIIVGEYYDDSLYQEITDVCIGDYSNKNEKIFIRKLTVSYFNGDGLFARGELIY